MLPNFRIPKLDTLTIRMTPAAVLGGVVGQVTPLKPRVLHLDTQCYDHYLINALGGRPGLEELYLGVVRPDGLGRIFFGTMEAENGRVRTHLRRPMRSFCAPVS